VVIPILHLENEYQNRVNSGGKGTVGCVDLDKEGRIAVAT
jgi:L-asparaginase